MSARGGIFLQRRFFQKRHHAISQQRRVAEILHRHRPIADAGVVEEVGLRTKREQQMIELELKLSAVKSMHASNFARAEIDILHVGFDHVDVAQNPAQRIHDVARRKIARRDFMQHRREENEILPRDQGHFHVRPSRQMLVQIFCRVEPGKSAAGDHDSCLFHASIFARRCAIVKDSLSLLSIRNRHAEVRAIRLDPFQMLRTERIVHAAGPG